MEAPASQSPNPMDRRFRADATTTGKLDQLAARLAMVYWFIMGHEGHARPSGIVQATAIP